MYQFTEKRMDKIRHLLDDANEKLRNKQAVDTGQLEAEIRSKLKGVGFKELEQCFEGLLRDEEYSPLAATFLEMSSGHGSPTSGAQISLAKAYGCRSYSDPNLPEARAAWFSDRGVNCPI